MKRSQAPSMMRKKAEAAAAGNGSNGNHGNHAEHGREQDSQQSTTIERLPLFGFLEVPNNLRRQYVIPGLEVTEKSIAARKVKVLGAGYHKTPFLRPGDLSGFVPVNGMALQVAAGDDEDSGGEDLPQAPASPLTSPWSCGETRTGHPPRDRKVQKLMAQNRVRMQSA